MPFQDKVIIEFNGGETFLNFEIVKKIIEGLGEKINSNGKKIQFRYIVQSNGTIINKEIISYIKKNNITIGISLDGPKNVHDKNRCYLDGKGTFDDILKNINLLKDANVHPNYLAVISSADDLKKSYYFLSKLNPKILKFNLVRTKGRKKEHIHIHEQKRIANLHIELFNKQLEELRNGANPPRLSNICHMIENILLSRKPYMCLRTPCGAGTSQIVFDYSGNLWPCQEFLGDENFISKRNNLEKPHEDLFMSDGLKLISNRKTENIDDCSICLWSNFCQGGCSAMAYYSNKNINTKSPHCEYYKIMFEKLIWIVVKKIDLVIEYVFCSQRGFNRITTANTVYKTFGRKC